MATRAELVEIFSEEGVITLPVEESIANKIPEQDARLLAEVGLPAALDVLFTLGGSKEPRAFTILPVDTGESVENVLVLGSPTDDSEMRYCLDLEDGYVILLDLGEEPAAEIVNSSLEDFIEFLYRYALRLKHIVGTTDEQADKYTEQLRTYLEARDPQAFADDEAWWSMVFRRLMGEEF
ncbi:SUKH-4 family immunity protein [Kitasatospora sp. NPDC001175]|uniref:SUKH-4 family immunity protein n=1 Tax=Kitasatospora sp. NPDC001175 TaxID=3157103 RepID=UPI003CFE7E51